MTTPPDVDRPTSVEQERSHGSADRRVKVRGVLALVGLLVFYVVGAVHQVVAHLH